MVYLTVAIIFHRPKVFFMKQSIFVASVVSNLDLPRTKLEEFVNKNKNDRSGRWTNSNIQVPGFENKSWRFVNSLVHGTVEMVFGKDNSDHIICIEIPVAAAFVAVCTKGSYANYELDSAVSLS